MWSSPPWSGSGGSTTTVSWNRSATCRRSSTRSHISAARRLKTSCRHSRNELSGKPGAVCRDSSNRAPRSTDWLGSRRNEPPTVYEFEPPNCALSSQRPSVIQSAPARI